MPFHTIRTTLMLGPGMSIRYDPPLVGGDAESQRFFRTYHGQDAMIVGFAQEWVGPLDYLGREPGMYHDPKGLKVRFADGTELMVNVRHCIVVGQGAYLPKDAAAWCGREHFEKVQVLPEPLCYYPGDLVWVAGEGSSPTNRRKVLDLIFDPEATAVSYRLGPTEEERRKREIQAQSRGDFIARRNAFVTVEDPAARALANGLTLARGGNVRALYEDADLHFESLEKELEFWSRAGLSEPVGTGLPHGAGALEEMHNRGADFLTCRTPAELRKQHPDLSKQCCSLYRLHDRWEKYRPRVRELNRKLYDCRISAA